MGFEASNPSLNEKLLISAQHCTVLRDDNPLQRTSLLLLAADLLEESQTLKLLDREPGSSLCRHLWGPVSCCQKDCDCPSWKKLEFCYSNIMPKRRNPLYPLLRDWLVKFLEILGNICPFSFTSLQGKLYFTSGLFIHVWMLTTSFRSSSDIEELSISSIWRKVVVYKEKRLLHVRILFNSHETTEATLF